MTRIARDSVGAENVFALGMPSPFSSKGSVEHARALCDNLEVLFKVASIAGVYDAVGEMMRPLIGWKQPQDFGTDVTEENVQPRIRGLAMMAVSNRTEMLVLTTGNKSEIAVGYCTLYGDTVGGLAVISDLPKTVVYGLARHLNATRGNIIPPEIIDKPPSAELRPEQKDQDSLPPYDILDEILRLYVEEGCDPDEIIVATGFDPAIVREICGKVDRNEYKRRQGALGLRVTTKAFGSGRRMPIATKPRELEVL